MWQLNISIFLSQLEEQLVNQVAYKKLSLPGLLLRNIYKFNKMSNPWKTIIQKPFALGYCTGVHIINISHEKKQYFIFLNNLSLYARHLPGNQLSLYTVKTSLTSLFMIFISYQNSCFNKIQFYLHP